MGAFAQNTNAPGSATRCRMLTPLPPGSLLDEIHVQGGGSDQGRRNGVGMGGGPVRECQLGRIIGGGLGRQFDFEWIGTGRGWGLSGCPLHTS